MDNKTVLDRTILECYVGSFTYGTNLPDSDKDEGGICIPTKEVYFGGDKFNQATSWTDEGGNKIDKTIFSIDKAVELILDNNPNMVDYLYLPERSLIKVTPEWERLLAVRDEFISTKCRQSYAGYAYSQLNRIKTHRAYLLNPVNKPNRSDYGLPEVSLFPPHQNEIISKLSTDWIAEELRNDFYRDMSSVVDNEIITVFRKYVDENLVQILMPEFKKGHKEFLHMISSISSRFLKDEYIDMAAKELAYMSQYTNWKRYDEWKKTRNKKRLELELKCGFDSKAASHACRLSRMAVEILEGKGVNVDRTNIDADELRSIRLGNHSYEYVMDIINPLEEKANELYKTSTLRKSPNRKLINSIKMDIIEKYLFK